MVGYERKSLQILGGGFNLLPPVDKVPITDYLLAQNWRVDRLGRLVSRWGYPQIFSIAGAGIAHSAGSFGGLTSPLYVGCNSGITPATSKLYYNGNPTPIASGFDGNRIGFATQNSWMWVMNRLVQGRHNAAGGWQTWNITPPAASPTVAAGSSPSPASSATYSYAMQGTTIAASIVAGTRTVTPASMTLSTGVPITVGLQLTICDALSVSCESVTVTAITGSTFTAAFRSSYTGPGILVGDPTYVHSVTIAGMTYSFVGNGYSQAQIPQVMAGISGVDPNCSVTYAGSGQNVVITPIPANILIPVSGSDGNAPANLANGSITSLPNGTYQFYVTFQSADLSLESNPSPVSLPVTVASQAIVVTIPAADAPVDTRIGFINIYATGGTLGSAYQVGQVASSVASPATTFTDTIPDLQATNTGIVMPVTNDPPPAASGIIGPFFSRLFAWKLNRLFWTDPNLPQYWPGSANNGEGNWVDVGDEGEAIVWCSIHTNTLVIYKERSIWMLTGPPDTGTLQQYRDGLGLAGQFALVSAGLVDYFVGPNGLYKFDLSNVLDTGGNIAPIFNSAIAHIFPLDYISGPGSVLPGTAYNTNSVSPYAISLGYATGKLYLGYAEKVSGISLSYCLMVFHEDSQRWFYHRNGIGSATGFFGFFFDGVRMLGLTGGGGTAAGYNVDDFSGFLTQDSGGVSIECIYQSHYENCGLPDNQKMFLEVVVDYEFAIGVTAEVYAAFENGTLSSVPIGTLIASPRASASFSLGSSFYAADGGVLARNISVTVAALATGQVIIHNVYLYYYVEARIAAAASTMPTDLGVGQVKQCKELQLDINSAGGGVGAQVWSDLPGNLLAKQQTIAVAQSAGRAVLKFPFVVTEGFLWQLQFAGTGFRLYGARLLMRVVGTYVEAYESAAGFVWDSMEMTFDSGVTHIPRGYAIALASFPVKRAREISLEIDTFGGAVTLNLLTDLPGNAQQSRFNTTVNTGGSGRRFYRIPLPQGGTDTPIEGRIYRLQFSGAARYILYGAAIDIMAVGVYVEAYEAAGGAVWDSTPVDLGNTTDKTFDQLRFEIDSDLGTPSVTIYTDLPGETMTAHGTFPLTGLSVQTTRHWATVPLPDGIEGRSVRLLISSLAGFRLYRAQVRSSAIGRYLAAATPAGNDALKTLEFDFNSERVKMYKRIEIDMRADGVVNLSVVTNQSGRLAPVYTPALATPNGRETILISLPPGVRGRLLRLLFIGTAAARIYHVRVWTRAVDDPKAQWDWQDYPLEESDVLPQWTDIEVAPTAATWFWAKVLAVAETADEWQLVDVPFEVTG